MLHSTCDGAEAVDDSRLERGDLVPSHDVGRDGEHLGAGVSGETLRGSVEPRRVDVGHRDPHALGRERLAQRETDPAGGAGDDGHLAVQLADHSFLKMSEPPAIIAIATPAPVTATMTSAVAATTG